MAEEQWLSWRGWWDGGGPSGRLPGWAARSGAGLGSAFGLVEVEPAAVREGLDPADQPASESEPEAAPARRHQPDQDLSRPSSPESS